MTFKQAQDPFPVRYHPEIRTGSEWVLEAALTVINKQTSRFTILHFDKGSLCWLPRPRDWIADQYLFAPPMLSTLQYKAVTERLPDLCTRIQSGDKLNEEDRLAILSTARETIEKRLNPPAGRTG